MEDTLRQNTRIAAADGILEGVDPQLLEAILRRELRDVARDLCARFSVPGLEP
jgi:hypothetical protein